MRLLLLNNNPAVSRLIKLSAEKAGYELDEFEDYGLVPLTTYDVILVDNELYEETAVAGLCEHTGCDYVVYVCQRGAKKPDAMNVALEKPFLPTDFLILMDKIKNVLASHKMEEPDEEESMLQTDEESDAFDIDKIDTLEREDDDMLPINLLEEHDDDFKEAEENNEKLTFDDLELDDLNLEDELFNGRTSEEKELINNDDEFSFDDVEPLEKEVATPFEDFDFEENDNASTNNLDTDEHDTEEDEHNPSILDKDDINEVKQLLDESEDNEDEKEITALSLDSLNQEEDDAGTFFFDEGEKAEESLEEDESLETELENSSDLSFEEVIPAVEDELEESLEKESASLEEDQEEIIDDFAEAIDEKIEEEKEQALEEEELLPKVGIAVNALEEIGDIDSLDDLSENMLKQAFGEAVDEEEVSGSLEAVVPAPKSQEIEVIRDEIESSIARSISSLAQSDILREALKGMRLNISITFDEKE